MMVSSCEDGKVRFILSNINKIIIILLIFIYLRIWMGFIPNKPA
jgi:hypothetical protein